MINFDYYQLKSQLKGTCKVDSFLYRFTPFYDDHMIRIVPQKGVIVGDGNRILLLTKSSAKYEYMNSIGIAEFSIFNSEEFCLRTWVQLDTNNIDKQYLDIIKIYLETDTSLHNIISINKYHPFNALISNNVNVKINQIIYNYE